MVNHIHSGDIFSQCTDQQTQAEIAAHNDRGRSHAHRCVIAFCDRTNTRAEAWERKRSEKIRIMPTFISRNHQNRGDSISRGCRFVAAIVAITFIAFGAGAQNKVLFITSTVTKGDTLAVTKTANRKCGRCWRHLPDVAEEEVVQHQDPRRRARTPAYHPPAQQRERGRRETDRRTASHRARGPGAGAATLPA